MLLLQTARRILSTKVTAPCPYSINLWHGPNHWRRQHSYQRLRTTHRLDHSCIAEEFFCQIKEMNPFVYVVRSLFTLINPAFWYTFIGLYVMSILTFGICFAIQNVAGQVARLLDKVLHMFSHTEYAKLKAVASLTNGTCDEFKHLGVLIRYFIAKMFGNPLCNEMAWYESITLTRIFISYPLRLVYPSFGTQASGSDWLHQKCSLNFQTDLCAGVVGGQTFSTFIYTEGIWIYVIISLFKPIISDILKALVHTIRKSVHVMHAFIHNHFMLKASH